MNESFSEILCNICSQQRQQVGSGGGLCNQGNRVASMAPTCRNRLVMLHIQTCWANIPICLCFQGFNCDSQITAGTPNYGIELSAVVRSLVTAWRSQTKVKTRSESGRKPSAIGVQREGLSQRSISFESDLKAPNSCAGCRLWG